MYVLYMLISVNDTSNYSDLKSSSSPMLAITYHPAMRTQKNALRQSKALAIVEKLVSGHKVSCNRQLR